MDYILQALESKAILSTTTTTKSLAEDLFLGVVS